MLCMTTMMLGENVGLFSRGIQVALDWEIRISGFAIEREIRKRISPPRNPSGFHGFSFTFRFGNPKENLQDYSREQWSSFC